jgi:hypothetical protein
MLGRENQLFAAGAAGVVVVAVEAGTLGAEGAMGLKELDPPLSTNAGSFEGIGPSLRILMVSPTGVGLTLKDTEVSSRFTNSIPSEALGIVAAGGVPDILR